MTTTKFASANKKNTNRNEPKKERKSWVSTKVLPNDNERILGQIQALKNKRIQSTIRVKGIINKV